jgi:hypothetical protein
MELIAHRLGMKVSHVPYKGASPALNDLLGGHIRVLISAVPNAHSHIAAGTIRALAVSGARRSALIPEVPTLAGRLVGYECRYAGAACRRARPRHRANIEPRAQLRTRKREARARLALEGLEPQDRTGRIRALIDRELTM